MAEWMSSCVTGQAGSTQRVSVSSAGAAVMAGSYQPAISSDGRYVTFTSVVPGLVAGDTNDRTDIFIRDRQAGTTERVSVSPSGAQGNDGSEQSSSVPMAGMSHSFQRRRTSSRTTRYSRPMCSCGIGRPARPSSSVWMSTDRPAGSATVRLSTSMGAT